MSALSIEQSLISPSEYLEGEELADCKHEYLNGVVYAMAGGTNQHSRIGATILSGLMLKLRGKPYQPWSSDTRIRFQHGDDARFYYPDGSVICHPVDKRALFAENPTVIFEVLSPSTERTDTGEKKDIYLRCKSVQAYVLIHSERVEVTIYTRRADGWDATIYNETTDTLPLPCIECELPLSEIYEE